MTRWIFPVVGCYPLVRFTFQWRRVMHVVPFHWYPCSGAIIPCGVCRVATTCASSIPTKGLVCQALAHCGCVFPRSDIHIGFFTRKIA